MDKDTVKSITLRLAVFFGLTTFVLCIAIFYIETLLNDSREVIHEKDAIIKEQMMLLDKQEATIMDKNREIEQLKDAQLPDSSSE